MPTILSEIPIAVHRGFLSILFLPMGFLFLWYQHVKGLGVEWKKLKLEGKARDTLLLFISMLLIALFKYTKNER